MFTLLRWFLALALAIAALVACSAPTPMPAAMPIEPPTSTPVPPTANSIPTDTPIPPTNTPQPTATSWPTNTATPMPTNTPQPSPTKAVTPKPTTAKGASAPASSGGGVSSRPSPLEDAIVRTLRAVESIGDGVNRMLPDQRGYSSGRVAADDPRCVQVINSHNAIPTFTMDPAGQPTSVQAAYRLYQEALNIYQVEVSNFPKACAAGEVAISPVGFGTLHKNVEAVLNKLRQAYASLK